MSKFYLPMLFVALALVAAIIIGGCSRKQDDFNYGHLAVKCVMDKTC